MRKQLLAVLAIMTLAIGLANCSDDKNPTGGDGNGNGDEDPTFAADVLPILTGNCGVFGCHDAETAEQGMILTASQAYNSIVEVISVGDGSFERVDPGDAENSYLIMKLEGRQTVGERMPFQRAPLSAAQIKVIRDWIDAGALNN